MNVVVIGRERINKDIFCTPLIFKDSSGDEDETGQLKVAGALNNLVDSYADSGICLFLFCYIVVGSRGLGTSTLCLSDTASSSDTLPRDSYLKLALMTQQINPSSAKLSN